MKRSCKKEPRTIPRENVVQKCADVLKIVKVSQLKPPKITVFSPEREEIIKLAPLALQVRKRLFADFLPCGFSSDFCPCRSQIF